MVHRTSVLAVALLVALSGATVGVGLAGAQQSTAAVEFTQQTSGGYTMTVDSVTLPDGGFVTIHDASLNDGDTLASVVGSSAYLEPGTHENVTVTLTEPVSEDGTYVAMPHRDDGDRVYEFVSANANADGPYTTDDGIVLDGANVTVSATVAASDQPTDGESVVVDRVEFGPHRPLEQATGGQPLAHAHQRVMPQRVDLHRLAPARRHHPVADLGIHPGELPARFSGVNQAIRVEVNIVAGALLVPVDNVR